LVVNNIDMFYGMMISEWELEEQKRLVKKAENEPFNEIARDKARLEARRLELEAESLQLDQEISDLENSTSVITAIIFSEDPIRGFQQLRARVLLENTDESGNVTEECRAYIAEIDNILATIERLKSEKEI
jgi:hypothetical protein